MERGSKRKAAAATPSQVIDLRPPKRQKPAGDSGASSTAETAATTTEVGTRYLAQLRRATDKTGRSIADAFSHLPDRNTYPDYYEQISMPLAIDTIEVKVNEGAYPNLTSLESDIRRMSQNAKEYNVKGSEVFEDAERVRKNAYNFMKIHNPAYKDPNYQAFPTPLPSKPQTIRLLNKKDESESRDQRNDKRSASAPQKDRRKSETVETIKSGNGDATEAEDGTFEGIGFQDAQRKLIVELKTYRNEDYKDIDGERPTFTDFSNLPSRENRHYYSIIKEPTSLNLIMKRVNGWKSREDQLGPTIYASWSAFEDAVAQIWTNAMTYNEDGSELYERAELFKQHFKERVTEAKSHVAGPPSLKVKLSKSNVASGKLDEKKAGALKLNLSGVKKEAPGPNKTSEISTPTSVPADSSHQGNAAQRADVRLQVNGHLPTASQTPAVRLNTGDSNSIKPEVRTGMGPPTAPHSGSINGSMPRNPSGSPHPGQTLAPVPTPAPYVPQQGFDSKWRPEGREPSLSCLNVTTHPDLHVTRPLTLSIPPHPKLTHQSVTANLAATHNDLRVRPTLAQSLQGPMGRPYKIYLTVNGMRITQRHEPPLMNGTAGPTTTGPSFDVKLMPGMNRLEFECAAAGGNRGVNGGRAEVELERVCVYANLMKS